MQLNVGILGTGYVAQKRADALRQDSRVKLKQVSGNSLANTESFVQKYSLIPRQNWLDLVSDSELDLIFVSGINRDHEKMVRASLESGKHVVVEYPLALEPHAALELIALARSKGLLLHVEHIELLGGVHQTIKNRIEEIGKVFYARYITINPQHQVGTRWTYNHELFGFPLVGALSRIHRFTDLFGIANQVSCTERYWHENNSDLRKYQACLCRAQIDFSSSLVVEIVYGKGEIFYQPLRNLELHGEKGTMIFQGEQGILNKEDTIIALETPPREGLIAKDTYLVLDYLLTGKPLYIQPEESLDSLRIANASYQSSTQNSQMVYINP
jgi:biliverdin reductase